LRTKIKNIVKDLHHKTATYLCKTFDKILLPKFGVKNMVIRKTKNIKNMTVRKMLSLSHCKFREIIKERSNKYNRKLYICNEAYTSKTRGRCGNIKGNLGGNETYNCSKCHLIIDRDHILYIIYNNNLLFVEWSKKCAIKTTFWIINP
jgi:putative transposase